ncbi:MAG: J domain-containing protein [Spirochaetales bacterium]|nr:J domain-containing protein [Spirochaetales bacterium]
MSASKSTARIISEIDRNLEIDGRWSLDVQLLARFVRHNIRDLYSDLYRIHETDGQELIIECFTESSVHELLLLLEHYGYESAEQEFAAAGLFLDHSLQTEVYASFVSVAGRIIESHTIRYEQYIHILEQACDQHTAAEKYIIENFDRKKIIRKAAEEFVESNTFTLPHSAVILAVRYLELLFVRHVVYWGQFFFRIQEQLNDFFYTVLHPELNPATEDSTIPSIVKKAMELFGIRERRFDKSALRKKYRSLVKRYHPDINRNGEEMTRTLIAAYAVLCSYIG